MSLSTDPNDCLQHFDQSAEAKSRRHTYEGSVLCTPHGSHDSIGFVQPVIRRNEQEALPAPHVPKTCANNHTTAMLVFLNLV